MPKVPKRKVEHKKAVTDEPEKSSWGEDQKERGYYYDDAHGYETYKPEDDDESECEDAEARTK